MPWYSEQPVQLQRKDVCHIFSSILRILKAVHSLSKKRMPSFAAAAMCPLLSSPVAAELSFLILLHIPPLRFDLQPTLKSLLGGLAVLKLGRLVGLKTRLADMVADLRTASHNTLDSMPRFQARNYATRSSDTPCVEV